MPQRKPDPQTGLIHLEPEECWERLGTQELGRLAVAVGRYPDIFPVNFAVRDHRVIIRTEAGTKLAAAVLGGRVAFEVDHLDRSTRTAWSVVISGTASEPGKLGEYLDLQGLNLDLWVPSPKSRIMVIEPESITGRELPPPS